MYCKYSKSATHPCSVPLQPSILMNTPTTAAIFGWTISAWCLTYFLPECLVRVKRKKNTNGVTVFSVSSVILGRKRAVFGHICSVKCKWRTSDTVSSFSPPCLLVAKRESWLARQAGATGSLCVYGEGMERCAQWITFPGNSCQIHQSRAEDTGAGPARPNPDTRLIGVDGRGGGRGLDCLPASNAGLKGFDGWPHRATWRGSQHPGSLLFNTLLISFIPPNADSMHSSAEHTGPTVAQDAAFVKVSVACTASQHGSPLCMTGDADPMKGD